MSSMDVLRSYLARGMANERLCRRPAEIFACCELSPKIYFLASGLNIFGIPLPDTRLNGDKKQGSQEYFALYFVTTIAIFTASGLLTFNRFNFNYKMSHTEVVASMKHLKSVVGQYLRHQELLRTTAESDGIAHGRPNCKEEETSDDEFYDGSTIGSPESNGFPLPEENKGDFATTSKATKRKKSDNPKSLGSEGDKNSLRRKLKRLKHAIREVEIGLKMNLSAIEQNLEKIKIIRDEVASCSTLMDML